MKIIDAHIHFYNNQVNKHSFLDETDPKYEAFVGDYSSMPRIYLPKDYLEDTKGLEVEGVVWHEFLSEDPVKEAKWAQEICKQSKLKTAMVTIVDFLDPDLEKRLEEYSALPSVTGVRQHLVWHPTDERMRFANRPDILSDPNWQKRLGILKRYDFKCGLEVFAHQLPDVLKVVKLYPEIGFTIAVMGWPIDLSEEGLKAFRRDIKNLGLCENTSASVSAIECIFGMNWSLEQVRPWVMEVIEAFGPNRTMFGSHMPISNLSCNFEKLFDAYLSITEGFSSDEKEDMFHHVAASWFNI